jgi:thermitase
MADDTRVTHSRSGIACTLALLCVLGCALPVQSLAADIIVRRQAGLSASERADVRADAGVKLERMLRLRDAEVVTVPADRSEQALAALKADPAVRLAVPDVAVHAAATPAPDQYFGAQWALDSGAGPDIDAPLAWENSSEGLGVTVGVADTLVNVDHPDLAGNIDPRVRQDPARYKFTLPSACAAPAPTGRDDHGTHVAGSIAAVRDNGIGIAGVAPNAKILPLRTLDNCGGGDISSVVDAFDFAGDEKIPIVTASFATDPLLPAGRKADLNNLINVVLQDHPHTLYVVAAGNEGNDNDALPVYPCNTLLPGRVEPDNLVCVGMTNRSDTPVCWGNVGQTSVDLFAPGTEIFSTVSGPGGYLSLSGTSMATPLVAAAAALLRSNDLTSDDAAQLKAELIDHGTNTYEGMLGISVSGGRLNAARLVGGGGPIAPRAGGNWVTCDRDHDGVINDADQCPDLPGKLHGCPDTDADLLRDAEDNCPGLANADQADADRDAIGDACDITPRGEDVDGDAKAALDDRCPYVPSSAADGCPVATYNPPDDGPKTGPPVVTPTPTPTPVAATRILDLDVQVTPAKCPKGHPNCRKAAKVTVKLSRRATVALKLELRVKRKGRWVWTRVTSKSLTATASGRTLTIRGKSGRSLVQGPYRVTASLSGASGKTALNFRV